MKKVLGLALAMVLSFSLTACSKSASADLKFGQVQYAAHGTKSFAVTSVVMDGDKISVAYIDEFQVMSKEGTQGVPNSDADFGANFPEDTQLVSKRVNNETYSNNMKEKAGATVSLVDSYEAIQSFAEGKTVAELEAAVNGKTTDEILDAVSGATLVDTAGYINSIIEAAKAAK